MPLLPRHRAAGPWRGALLAVTLAMLGAAPGAAAADEPGPSVAVPVGTPVSMDGVVTPAEWADAQAFQLEGGVAEVRLKQYRGVLMLGLTAERAWVRGTHLWVAACPDLPEMHALAPGALTIDYEPLDHSRPHLLVQRQADPGQQPVEGAVVLRAVLGGRRSQLELGLKLAAVDVKLPKPRGVRVAVALLRGLEHSSPTWPAGLRIWASPGTPPPDLISSARWARLSGWVDAGGPGAWPARDWDAWTAADRELTEKGMRAHAKALEIVEESGRKLEKHDGEVERELFEPLAWIAAREPLHPYDVLVRAQALRHLNRHEEALAALDALATLRETDFAPTLLHQRAVTLEGRERYEEAAAAWEALAAASGPNARPRYETAARRAAARAAERDRERVARAEDEADPALPRVLLETSRGTVLVVLHGKDVPRSVEHFLRLVRMPGPDGGGFYDGTLFHRVLGEQLAQGGDPRTRGGDCDADLSGPAGATAAVEANPRHGFWRGALGFARGPRQENASQFFLLSAPRPELAEEGYTCFGHVVAGQSVVDRLERCDVLLRARVVTLEPAPAEPPAAPAEPAAPAPGAAPVPR